jgi:hypothetical protein
VKDSNLAYNAPHNFPALLYPSVKHLPSCLTKAHLQQAKLLVHPLNSSLQTRHQKEPTPSIQANHRHLLTNTGSNLILTTFLETALDPKLTSTATDISCFGILFKMLYTMEKDANGNLKPITFTMGGLI